MKKITLLLLLSFITPLVFSQVIVNPVYDGTFDGTTYSQTFNFPTGALSYAGFANNNVSIYPLSYPNGGQVSFKATVASNAEIKFVFEADLYPNTNPSVSTVNVTLLASNTANTVYTVAIPASATNTYKSALMYVVTRDVDVNISETKLIKYDTDGTTQLKVDFPVYDGTFAGSTYSQTFNFPTGAQVWAGFANNNKAIYPLSFTSGINKVSFKATVATNAEIKFVFEKDLYPNISPSVFTANVALLASNPDNTLYEVEIPVNATNTYKSALMYIITRDVAVNLSEIKIHLTPTTPPSAQTYDLLASFNGTGLEDTFGGATAEYATNPVGTDQVIKLTGNGTNVWQGLNVSLGTNYRLTAATQLSMQLDVYSTTALTIAPKAQAGVAGAPDSVTSATHSGSGWETLTFTFDKSLDGKAPANGDYSDFALHLNWNIANNSYGTPDGRIFYIKNLKGLAVTAPVVANPTVAAPTPPARDAGNVISLFSDKYTNVASNFDAGWCEPNSVQEVTIVNNPTMAFKNKSCQGIVLNSGIDASSFTNLHVDVYIEAGTDLTSSVFNLKFVNKPDGAALEINFNVTSTPALVAGSWLQIDVPVNLTNFTGFKEFGITSNLNNKVWYDNLYAYKEAALGTAKFEKSNLKVYPNPATTNVTIEANGAIERVSVFNILGQEVLSKSPKANNTTLDISNLQKGTYIVRTSSEGKTQTTKVLKK